MIQKTIQNFKSHAHHFFFLLILILLVTLTAWWTLFIKRSIDQAYHYQTTLAEKQAEIFALKLRNTRFQLVPGPIQGHTDYEITTGKGLPQASEIRDGLYVQPTLNHLMKLENERLKKRSMVFGEGAVFGLSVLVSCFMLYYTIRLEKRSREELYEFWNRVTHEIKTPITGIRAFLETLKRGTLSKKDLDYMVDLALKQVERQQQLTQNILVGRQLEKGLKVNQNEPLIISDFIENYIRSHSLQLARIRTCIESGDGKVRVCADPNNVHTILDNLVDNALKYGPKDLELTFAIREEKDEVSIDVKDNGPGFPPEMSDHLFDAYRRLAGELPEGKHGTGMGLHICRSLARQMDGEMTARSEGRGTGATFSLKLKKVVEDT